MGGPIKLTVTHLRVDAKDSTGRTALFYAVRGNVEESARILIFRGADHTLSDKKGKSILDLSSILTRNILLQIAKEKFVFFFFLEIPVNNMYYIDLKMNKQNNIKNIKLLFVISMLTLKR